MTLTQRNQNPNKWVLYLLTTIRQRKMRHHQQHQHPNNRNASKRNHSKVDTCDDTCEIEFHLPASQDNLSKAIQTNVKMAMIMNSMILFFLLGSCSLASAQSAFLDRVVQTVVAYVNSSVTLQCPFNSSRVVWRYLPPDVHPQDITRVYTYGQFYVSEHNELYSVDPTTKFLSIKRLRFNETGWWQCQDARTYRDFITRLQIVNVSEPLLLDCDKVLKETMKLSNQISQFIDDDHIFKQRQKSTASADSKVFWVLCVFLGLIVAVNCISCGWWLCDKTCRRRRPKSRSSEMDCFKAGESIEV